MRHFPIAAGQTAGEALAMVRYRRNRVVAGTCFFTVTLRDRRSDLLARRIDLLRDAWRAARARIPHAIIAAAILPDHLHAVIRMRDLAGDYPRLWQDVKKGFTRRLCHERVMAVSPWQPRYWEHTIRDHRDLENHVDYIHDNPVKHGLVDRAAQWPHPTFHRYVQRGWLPAHWSGPAQATRWQEHRSPGKAAGRTRER